MRADVFTGEGGHGAGRDEVNAVAYVLGTKGVGEEGRPREVELHDGGPVVHLVLGHDAKDVDGDRIAGYLRRLGRDAAGEIARRVRKVDRGDVVCFPGGRAAAEGVESGV